MPEIFPSVVMAGPAAGRVPAIHAFAAEQKDVDGRDKHGHDGSRGRRGSVIRCGGW
jgi:hypothetical protein